MRQYSELEQSIQEAFEAYMPLSPAQSGRVVQLCVSILEARDLSLSMLSRVLPHNTQQASRIRWIQRLLEVSFVSQSHLLRPLLQHALSYFKVPVWHLVIDRTDFPVTDDTDLAVISLIYNKRAIPLVWQQVPQGGATQEVYGDLIEDVKPLIPASQKVIFHGDTEFGSAYLMRQLKSYGWHFMLAVTGRCHLWLPRQEQSNEFRELVTGAEKTCYFPGVACFATHREPVNAFAFPEKHHSGGKKRREMAYIVTTLPLDHTTKRLGKRRWGIEPFFKDYKSSGWQIDTSDLSKPERIEGLLVFLAICYVWMVTTGRWLSKVGRRREVDRHRKRHYSLFRIGWDWMVSMLKRQKPPPIPLRLYT